MVLRRGFGLLALGTLSQRIVRGTGGLPAQLGWYLLAIGVPLQILCPASGAPGLIVLGVLALIAARRGGAGESRRTPLSPTTEGDPRSRLRVRRRRGIGRQSRPSMMRKSRSTPSASTASASW
ncbi:DUF6463 family protein [Streptomyces sp. NPDC059991]|uniref:DUF6463 family protein n=1 Tax=Streptomyces sp. NPDC059991 TaxID=3347028 RepID=UPI00367BD50B